MFTYAYAYTCTYTYTYAYTYKERKDARGAGTQADDPPKPGAAYTHVHTVYTNNVTLYYMYICIYNTMTPYDMINDMIIHIVIQYNMLEDDMIWYHMTRRDTTQYNIT